MLCIFLHSFLLRADDRAIQESDVWWLGCILHQIVYGEWPFSWDCPSTQELVLAPLENEERTDVKELNNIIRACLNRDLSLRPTIDDLLVHPFLGGIRASDDGHEQPKKQAQAPPTSDGTAPDSSQTSKKRRRAD